MRVVTGLLGFACLASAAAVHEQYPFEGVTDSVSTSSNHGHEDAPSYRASLLALHKALVSIPSTSGAEQDVGETLVDILTSLGYNVERQFLPVPRAYVDGNDAARARPRFNVLATRSRKSGSSQPPVLVTSHMDAVPPHIPYGISDKHPGLDTVISGRGSVDDKASIAAQIIALEELRSQGEILDNDVMLAFVVSEETNGAGMRYFSSAAQEKGLKFEAAIFGEPTEGKLACGHKGHAGCTIRAKGKAGHSGYPWLGKSATEVITRVLIRVLNEDLGSSERFGNTTVNIGVLEGGVAANVIAEHASTTIALRLAAGDQATGWDIVREKLEGILKEVDEEALSMDCTNGYGPIECDCDVDGFDTIIVNYGTDAANLEGDHIRYLYGPGSILVAHGDNEAITVRDLEAAVEGYKTLVKHALENTK
ncbi:hypothetical protein GE09DRAFT_498059 [Coniochaeta sp. 2T2.1]|nr:hypothetical protein GE09DRAFT_498059 [Coniochaeta sp. 2T2.1]